MAGRFIAGEDLEAEVETARRLAARQGDAPRAQPIPRL